MEKLVGKILGWIPYKIERDMDLTKVPT
jgi:hypothetical protein